ncbi:Alpha/beta hydrolase family protein [Friedmanniella luteola]|uniref:Alpha/beta hydrolase family protein n=1 Tax=Friedmanniella luteola TaxID=546871 RepID=A0A1H1MKX5_9ACTN|nr:alpha/beta hydrolase [Friedmanniella luteola]SDR87491.1 Alpha/beta hydrolase family protein [Friedmanniella luteola]
MAKTGVLSRRVLATVWLVVGAAMVAVPVWLGWTRWQPVLMGHPLMLGLTIGCGLLGFVALAWAFASLVLGDRSEDDETRPRTERQRARRASRRIALAVPALFVCVLLVGALAWSRPFPASPVAVAAMRSGGDVRVSDRLTWFEMASTARDDDDQVVRPTTGLVFVPGARVDPRAYANVLRPLARAGYLVTVLKEPFGVSFVDAGHPERVMAAHPEIAQWVVAGHSLGGVTAASFADGTPTVGDARVAGLVLWASYPARRLERPDLRVTSVAGERDGLSTPATIDAAKDDLPPDTTYVVVPGAVHSWFGDYGDQPGDGTPTGDRAAAQAQITKATRAVLAAVTPKPPAKKK